MLEDCKNGHDSGMRQLAMLALVLSVAPAFATQKPHLVIMSKHPFVVRGSNFVSGESVRVSVTGATSHVRVVRVSGTRTLVARFGTIALGRCGSYLVQARGDHGSVAALKFVGECPELQPADR
jgi:hypothetical protein